MKSIQVLFLGGLAVIVGVVAVFGSLMIMDILDLDRAYYYGVRISAVVVIMTLACVFVWSIIIQMVRLVLPKKEPPAMDEET